MNILHLLFFLLFYRPVCAGSSTKCLQSCLCDIHNGFKRVRCNHRFIVDVNLIIPNNAQIYDVSYNSISKLDDYCFKGSNFRSIIELNLSENTIFWIGLHGFSGLPHLKKLNLRHNRLEGIPPDIFFYNPALEEVDLSENKFLSIADQPFISHNYLKVLNLRQSLISFLPTKVFTELPNLRHLDLSGNNLIELHIPTLETLSKLSVLTLDENDWQCNDQFRQLQDWIVDRDIHFELQCRFRDKNEGPNMFEKIITLDRNNEDEEENGLPESWEDKSSEVVPKNNNNFTTNSTMNFIEKFNAKFPPLLSLIIGFKLGILIGASVSYCCTSGLCSCRCKPLRLRSRRQRMREARRNLQEGREQLLWSVLQSSVETPPVVRRQMSNDDAFCRTSSWEAASTQNSVQTQQQSTFRSETPPPTYNACIDDVILSQN